MRELGPPPSSLVRSTSSPFDVARDVVTGSFAGPLPAVRWAGAGRAAGHGPLWRIAHEKRWIYVAVRGGDRVVAAAVIRTGYAATALTWIWDAERPGFVDERVAKAPTVAAEVVDDGPGARSARFAAGGLRIAISDQLLVIDAAPGAACPRGSRATGHPIHARIDLASASAAPIAAVVPVPGGLASATQKHLATARGEVIAGGARVAIDDGLAAFDYTNGLLARRTAWRWALALGRTREGRRIALNLVEGFVGEGECGLWVDDALIPLGEGRFELDPSEPSRPWRVRTSCGAVDLRFVAGAVHAQTEDLLLVRSRFVQPAGRFTGTIRAAGEELGDLDLLGVVEDQDVIW